MQTQRWKKGSVLLMAVFVVALLSGLVIGMLQVNVEELQIMYNQIRAAEALAVAEAGLNEALAELRDDRNWHVGFTDKRFSAGTYTVTVDGSRITSVGRSTAGYTARMEARVMLSHAGPPYVVAIDSLRVNE
jgi:type II secretory pathway component PulK